MRPSLTLGLAIALATLVLCASPRASAWTFVPARPVPNAIAGAADAHVAALFYNPAALGPLRGVRIWWDAGVNLQLGSIRRDAGEAAQAGQSTTLVGPSTTGLLGATWDFFSNRITAGIGIMTPANSLTSYSPSSAVRYQSIWDRGATLVEMVGVGIRITSRFFIGAGATFTEHWIDQRFARDLAPYGGSAGIDQPSALCGGRPCGLENPLATQDVRVQGFGWGAGLTAGILIRPIDRLWLGLSYFSRPFQPYHGDAWETGTTIHAAPSSPDPGCGGACVGRSFANSVVPDIIMFAVRVEATPRIEVEGSARWVHYGYRSALDLFMQGGQLPQLAAADPASAVPAQTRIDQGRQDAYSVGASLRIKLNERVRIQPSVIFESSAVDYAYINAANLDANKLDLALTLEWHPRDHLTVGAHVGGVAYLVGHAGDAFDPRAEASCVDAHYDLNACQKEINGAALPSAAGRYSMGSLHAGFALGMDY